MINSLLQLQENMSWFGRKKKPKPVVTEEEIMGAIKALIIITVIITVAITTSIIAVIAMIEASVSNTNQDTLLFITGAFMGAIVSKLIINNRR